MEVRDKLVEFLARVYRVFYAKEGRKIRRKNVLDVFQHRLKVASLAPTFPKFVERLAYGLGLQSISVDQELADFLMKNEEEVIRMAREESVLLTVLAYNRAKSMRGGGSSEDAQG